MNVHVKDLIGTNYKGFKIKNYKRENKRTFLYAECPFCGIDKWIRKDALDQPDRISCGCKGREQNRFKMKDITDKKFGRLKAIKNTGKRDKDNGSCLWLCECECGNIKEVSAADLSNKFVQSCGCLGLENSKKRKNCRKLYEREILHR